MKFGVSSFLPTTKASPKEILQVVHDIIPKNIGCAYVRQPEALGLGLAVLCAKPLIGDAPSDLPTVGRYVLVPRILSILKETKPGAGGEIQLTDAISTLLDKQRVLAL